MTTFDLKPGLPNAAESLAAVVRWRVIRMRAQARATVLAKGAAG